MTERKKKKAGNKIVKFAKKNFAREYELADEFRSKEIDDVPVIEAYYKGSLDPAIRKSIDKYDKLPTQQNYNGNIYKTSYYFKWAGLEAFKKDIETISIAEKNAFKCNIAMAFVCFVYSCI